MVCVEKAGKADKEGSELYIRPNNCHSRGTLRGWQIWGWPIRVAAWHNLICVTEGCYSHWVFMLRTN